MLCCNLRCQGHEARLPINFLVTAAVLLVQQLHELPQMPLLVLMPVLHPQMLCTHVAARRSCYDG